MSVDIAGVGFGPAMGGFLTTLSRNLLNADGTPRFESSVIAGDATAGDLLRTRGRAGFRRVGRRHPGSRHPRQLSRTLISHQIPMAAPVRRRNLFICSIRLARAAAHSCISQQGPSPADIRFDRSVCAISAVELPFIPKFMRKHDGMIFSLGQFNPVGERAGHELGSRSGLAGNAGSEPLIEEMLFAECVLRIKALIWTGAQRRIHARHGCARRAHGGGGRAGRAVGRQIDSHFGMPEGHRSRRVGARHEDGDRDCAKILDCSPGRFCTPSDFPSRRSLAFSTCILTDWRPSASSFRRGSAVRCGPLIDTCSISCFILICGGICRAER